jgi:beta-glucosidase
LLFTLQTPGDIEEIRMEATGISKEELQKAVSIYIMYDPMNPGEAVKHEVRGNRHFSLAFTPKYGAHVKILFKENRMNKPLAIREISFVYAGTKTAPQAEIKDKP